jgi:hypothetical protein
VSKWRYTFSTTSVPTEDEWSNWETEQTEMTINSGYLSGRYYLHIQAYDEANNLTERTVGPFNLDNSNPVINGVDVEKQGLRNTLVTVHAYDEHSGIVGYAITKFENATYNLRTREVPVVPEFQESNQFTITEDGLYTVWTIDALGNIETSICEVTDSDTTSNSTIVYAEIGSVFKVTIPKKITIDGTTKSGSYTVTVTGDIAGVEIIKVEPEVSVTLSSVNLTDVIAPISQDKINWKYDEMLDGTNIIANGAINASDITAGSWTGNFNFNIKLITDKKYVDSIPNVEYEEIEYIITE